MQHDVTTPITMGLNLSDTGKRHHVWGLGIGFEDEDHSRRGLGGLRCLILGLTVSGKHPLSAMKSVSKDELCSSVMKSVWRTEWDRGRCYWLLRDEIGEVYYQQMRKG